MPGEVKDPTILHWKCVTCREIHHPLLETTRYHGPHWKFERRYLQDTASIISFYGSETSG